jgi:hypothetical protein
MAWLCGERPPGESYRLLPDSSASQPSLSTVVLVFCEEVRYLGNEQVAQPAKG